MTYQEELKSKTSEIYSKWLINMLEHHNFVYRDRWFEKDEYKVYITRDEKMMVTEEGRTIFIGKCLDGTEMISLMKMVGIIER